MAAKGETQPIVTVQATNATLQTVPGTGPAPAAMSMAGLAEADGVRIEQVFDLMEVVSGCEAKNRYRVKPMVGGVPGPQTMFIKEESDCCERICCGPTRSLTLHIHAGVDTTGAEIAKLEKSFGCSECCCCRPSYVIKDGQDHPLGEIEDPCRCCMIDQIIKNVNGDPEFTAKGSVCQLGFCCPCISDPMFKITNMQEQEVGSVTKKFGGCKELCGGSNNFETTFPAGADEIQKMLLIAVTMGLDLAYFEKQKGGAGGGGGGF